MNPEARAPASDHQTWADVARRLRWSRLLAILGFIAITVAVLLLQDRIGQLVRLGYVGAFAAGLASSATVVLPAPGLAIIFVLGHALPNPWVVGLAAGLGATVGELTGYLAGYGGSAIVEDRPRYEWLKRQMQRSGLLLIALLAAIPNPAFDLAGIAAGALRIPVGHFLVACWPGKTLKAVLIALAGAGLLPGLAELFGVG